MADASIVETYSNDYTGHVQEVLAKLSHFAFLG
jgi:hypothetical protein